MNEDKNVLFISKILEFIPPNINAANYLADILGISTKSVYRRLKGEIPFTITEVFKLAKELKFSIDQFLELDNTEHVFFNLQANETHSPHDSFKLMLLQYYDHTQRLNNAKEVESLIALNHIPTIFSIHQENLFKFSYYQWIHLNHKESLKYRFCDIIIPTDILSLKNKVVTSAIQNKNNTFFFAPDIILSKIREIQYYYKRKLINDDEMLLLKKDLHEFIDYIEFVVGEGGHSTEVKSQYYLMAFNFKVSNSYIKYDNTVISNIMIHTINPINIFNSCSFSKIQKKWFDNIKKYAVSITQSNEVMQSQFLEKQRDYIEGIFDI